VTLGGVAELLFGVKAEGRALEEIAKPLTAEEAEEAGDEVEAAPARDGGEPEAPGYEGEPAAARDSGDPDATPAERGGEPSAGPRAAPTGRSGAPQRVPTAHGGRPVPPRRSDDRGARPRRRRGAYRLGPGRGGSSPGMAVSAPVPEVGLERDVERLVLALQGRGPTRRQELARLVGARRWGPGRFSRVLGLAVEEGRLQRAARSTYTAADPQSLKLGNAEAVPPRGGPDVVEVRSLRELSAALD